MIVDSRVSNTRMHPLSLSDSLLTMNTQSSGDLTAVLIVVSSVVVLLLFCGKLLSNREGPPLPPGPKGWPIIGSAFDLPDGRLYEWAAEQSKIHGKCALSST